MDNEEKILSALEQMNGRLDKIDGRLDGIDNRLNNLENDVSELKEHAEVTRSATNSLVEWADTVGVITQVNFPVKKVQ